jgi:hypothetical protein
MVCLVAEKEGMASIHYPGNHVTGPQSAASALRFLARARAPFCARDLPEDLTERSKVALVRRFVREGLLRVAHRTAVDEA